MKSKTHWKECCNKDYIGAWYCMEEDKTLTVKRTVRDETIVGEKGRKDKGTVVYFEERGDDGKPLKMVMNVSNFKTMEKVSGSPFLEDWPGTKIVVYADPDVMFAGEKVGGIRIRPYSPKQETYICADCGKTIEQDHQFSPRTIAERSRKAYGRTLCMDCAKKAKEAQVQAEKEGDILGDEGNEDKDS